MKDTFSIGKLTEILKINKETVRYYEKLGLLSEPEKNDSGYRIYTKEDVDRISFILIVKDLGFSLKEIKYILTTMYDDIRGKDSASIKELIDIKINELNKKISELVETKKLLEKVRINVDDNKCNVLENIYQK